MTNYFISDMHFGHKNVLSFDARPFTSIDKHDNFIVTQWNKAVSLMDDIYILGDVSWHNATKTCELLSQLNGIKHLIRGNHDTKLLRNKDFQSFFVEITDYKELAYGTNQIIVLCHYPIPCFNKHYYGSYHLYGHVHNSWEENMIQNLKLQMDELNIPCNMKNVGVMMPYMNYAPRTLEEIFSLEGSDK